MENNERRVSTTSSEQWLLFVAIGAGTVAVALAAGAVHLGNRLNGEGAAAPANPLELVLGLLDGSVTWPGAAGWWALGLLVVAVVLVLVLILSIRRRARRRRSRVDPAARYMGRGDDVAVLSEKSATKSARRFGVDATGVPIGNEVVTGQRLFGSWEDQHVDIWGPRTGKTTSRVVPAILEAPGAVLVTSNKRDVVDATRDVRAAIAPVWIFDPQGVAAEEPTWWWNPLTYVKDEVQAARLAQHFASGTTKAGDRGDAHFEPKGRTLLAALFYAAALDERPITDVAIWLNRPSDETAAEILQRHGVTLTAEQLLGIIYTPDRERGSIYSTAQRMAECLTNRRTLRWVTPLEGHTTTTDPRPQFDPTTFVTEPQTLYSLSKEGIGNAGPLVTALTVAVVEAAEDLATRSPGGRLRTPLLGALDEAANVCRWTELPNLYSHYGSRGIVLMTILQSWSQGVDVWGESGMKKLWSAANVAVYGGGVKETEFLETISKLVGDYDQITTSTSRGRGHRSVSQSITERRILPVSKLSALPKGRAVVMASGAVPSIVRTQPWITSPYAKAVEASIKAHDPHADHTIHEAHAEVAKVQADDGATDDAAEAMQGTR